MLSFFYLLLYDLNSCKYEQNRSFRVIFEYLFILNINLRTGAVIGLAHHYTSPVPATGIK
jgi:hypothetical protein